MKNEFECDGITLLITISGTSDLQYSDARNQIQYLLSKFNHSKIQVETLLKSLCREKFVGNLFDCHEKPQLGKGFGNLVLWDFHLFQNIICLCFTRGTDLFEILRWEMKAVFLAESDKKDFSGCSDLSGTGFKQRRTWRKAKFFILETFPPSRDVWIETMKSETSAVVL